MYFYQVQSSILTEVLQPTDPHSMRKWQMTFAIFIRIQLFFQTVDKIQFSLLVADGILFTLSIRVVTSFQHYLIAMTFIQGFHILGKVIFNVTLML